MTTLMRFVILKKSFTYLKEMAISGDDREYLHCGFVLIGRRGIGFIRQLAGKFNS